MQKTSKKSVPVKEKLACGAGEVANRFGENGVNDPVMNIYTLILGASPATIGVILSIQKIWDAISDPIMGYVSDNWKGKKGRRKPFILIGSILMTLTYPLLWYASPNWTEWSKAIYFIAISIIFFTSYTIFSVPFRALTAEITPDYQERTIVRAYAAVFNKIICLLFPWFFTWACLFGDAIPDRVYGIRLITTIASVFILISGIICALIPEERYHKIAVKQEKVKIKSLFSLVKDTTFLKLQIIGIGLLSSILVIGPLGGFVNIFYVWSGDQVSGSAWSAWKMNLMTVVGFIILFTLSKFLIHIEKKKLLKYALLLAMLGSFARWFTYSPDNPYLIFLDPLFFAPAYTIFWAIWLSMGSDYCDYDELQTGVRREGLINAIGGWIIKASSAIAVFLSGITIVMTGFKKEYFTGEIIIADAEKSEILFLMRLAYVGIPLLFILVAIIMNALYPLTKERMSEIREKLEERRGII